MLVSAVQQCESDITICISPLPLECPANSLHPTPSRSLQSAVLGSLCFTVASHQLSILQIAACIWGFPGGSVVRNLPAVQETWVWSLGREDPLEEGMAIHSSFLAWESHRQRSLVGYSPWGPKESDTTEMTEHACSVFVNATFLIHLTFSFPSCVHEFISYVCVSIPSL